MFFLDRGLCMTLPQLYRYRYSNPDLHPRPAKLTTPHTTPALELPTHLAAAPL